MSIIKYLVIAGVIIGVIYYVRKSLPHVFDFVKKPFQDVSTGVESILQDQRDLKKSAEGQATMIKTSLIPALYEKQLYEFMEIPDYELKNAIRKYTAVFENKISDGKAQTVIKLIQSITQPYQDQITKEIGYLLKGFGSDDHQGAYDNLKEYLHFDQDYWLTKKDVLTGEAYRTQFINLWKQGIKLKVSEAMLKFDIKRRKHGATEEDMSMWLSARGQANQYPTKEQLNNIAMDIGAEGFVY